MSLYNMLFGHNKASGLLLAALDYPKVGRFRDAWVTDDGKKIVIFTRNGGGNRECWHDEEEQKNEIHKECLSVINAELQKHPLYITDYDDESDTTYAYFEFKTPEMTLAEFLVKVSGQPPKPLGERFNEEMERIRKMTPDEIRQKFPEVASIIDQITRGVN